MARSRPALAAFVPLHHTVAAAALTALHLGAWAQVAGQLQEVTVTAERRLENIREVPSSVTALQGDILEAVATSGQDVPVSYTHLDVYKRQCAR